MTIQAYARDLSVRAGETLQLCVSTDAPRFRVRFSRQGQQLEHIPSLDTSVLTGYNVPSGPPSDDWGWPAYDISIPEDLPSGPYIAMLTEIDADGNESEPAGDPLTRLEGNALVVVRPAVGGPQARILYKISAATYHAYNEAGGASFYSRASWWRGPDGSGFKVTLRRTGCGLGSIVMCGEAPDPYRPDSRRQTFAHWDLPLVQWLEREGIDCDYCTDFDLEHDPTVLHGYQLVLSVGHDEYWSDGMRDRIVEFVDQGGNVAYFSGNLVGWRIGFADGGTAIFTSKQYPGRQGLVEHQSHAWRALDKQAYATGVGTGSGGGWWDGFRAMDGYVVQHSHHWVYGGTGLNDGDVFGLHDGKPLLGYEVDGTAYREQGSTKIAIDSEGRQSGFTILAAGPLSPGWVTRAPKPCATMGFMTSQSGGMTFVGSTTDWPMYVGSDPIVGRITRNVIDQLRVPSVRIVGPVAQAEDAGLAQLVEGRECAVWVDLASLHDRVGANGLQLQWTVAGAEILGPADTPVLRLKPSLGEALLTVSVVCRRADEVVAFGSKSLVVATRADGLRIDICAAIRNIAMPTDPAAPLFAVDQSTQERIRDVSQSRLGWLASRADGLADLANRLQELWTETGDMAGTVHDPDVVRWDRARWPQSSDDATQNQ